MKADCVRSCKGICAALENAEKRERESIALYREYVEKCDYPDVREIMAELIIHREQAIKHLAEKRAMLMVKFNTLDRIADSFV